MTKKQKIIAGCVVVAVCGVIAYTVYSMGGIDAVRAAKEAAFAAAGGDSRGAATPNSSGNALEYAENRALDAAYTANEAQYGPLTRSTGHG